MSKCYRRNKLLSKIFKDENPDKFIITTAMEHMANYLPFKVNFPTKVVGITEKENLIYVN